MVETRRHRRIDAVLLVGAATLVGVAGFAGATVAAGERVTGLWAGARVGRNGDARIVEVVDYDFGSRRRHGIFREVPGLDPASPVQVFSPTAPDQVDVTGTAEQARVRVGDPARTVSGRHRYTISYPLAGVAPGGRLAWDAVGTSWTVGIAGAELHVVAPWRLEDARCVRGATGSQDPCPVAQPEPGHLVATVDRLDDGEGVTLYAAAGARLASPPVLPDPPAPAADPGTGPLPPALVAGAAALAGAVPASRLARRAGRERVAAGGAADAAFGPGAGAPAGVPETLVDPADLARLATVEFTPPGTLTPAQGGVLLAEEVRNEHKVAWLIGAAVDGHLELEDDGRQVTLVRRHDSGRVPPYQLERAFDGRERLPLGSYDPSFAAAWRSVGSELDSWRQRSGLWDPAGDRRRNLARAAGGGAGLAGLAVAVVGAILASRSGPVWLVVAALGGLLAGAGAAAAVRAWELPVRTPAGSGLWLRTESFRRFLAASEAHHAEEAARLGRLREYTAWAVAVGELDRWSRAVAASGAAAKDPAGVRYPVLVPTLLSGSSRSSTEPSSSGSGSGSGGGGGGGVGGGAGGGGGGSW